MKPIKTLDATRPYILTLSHPFPWCGPRCALRPRLVATRFFPRRPASAARTTLAPRRPPLAQPPRDRTPPLASRLLGRITARSRPTARRPPPRSDPDASPSHAAAASSSSELSNLLVLCQYVYACEVWDLFSYQIIVVLMDMNLLTCLCLCWYPAGKGKDSYQLRLEGKVIQERDGYANGGKCFTLTLPCPLPS
jgi:hypothetical protein